MELDANAARELVDAAYAAWSRGDVEEILAQYDDEVTFWSNVGGATGEPLTIIGKTAFRAFVESLAREMEGVTVTEHFHFANGIARAKVEYYVRHKATRQVMSGSYRQITRFRGGRIARVEQYHDAARTAAFLRMTSDEPALDSVQIPRDAAQEQ
jgi:ketosteroid isomerase-like protein